MKKVFLRKRTAKKAKLATDDLVAKELICSRCKAIFPDYLARCPECGSEEWVGLIEVNPYTRMPMENFLKACGHVLWLMGTFGFLLLLWQTNSSDAEVDLMYTYAAITLLFFSIISSAAYFGLSEITRRILRVQRRLKAFHENYREEQTIPRHRQRKSARKFLK